jgi:hypothetical protein
MSTRHPLAPWSTLLALALLAAPPQARSQTPAAAPSPSATFRECLGLTRSLIVSSGMPYTPVRVQGSTGFFVVDLGADGSVITPSAFLGANRPQPLPGQPNRFAGVDFFGPWAPLRLSVQDPSGIQGPLPQAGLIGTDLLRGHVVTLDYAGGLLHRAEPSAFCRDDVLRRAGFRALSSRDYYGTDPAALRCPAAPRGGCPNIPTIPVRIGTATAVAQIDTGYDDGLRPALNINRAWLRQLQTAGVPLQREPAADLHLSTCAGVSEAVLAYRLSTGTSLELVGEDGRAVRRLEGITLFLKDTPAAARRCGGIGTWEQPAGQLGASSVNDATLVVDPVGQRVWLRPPGP